MTLRDISTKTIDFIVPIYNESNNINAFFEALSDVLRNARFRYRILFVNDGSRDDSLEKLVLLANDHANISIINLTRNFGKEAALTAGFEHSTNDIAIPIDADLQHPPAVILELIQQWEKGFDHVIAIRRARNTESRTKQCLARAFYKIINACSEFHVPNNAGDFRLLSRNVIEHLIQCKERNRFMKGLYVWIGGETTTVFYDVNPRANEKSRFTLTRLFRLALDAITSFTTLPLRVWSLIGVLICLSAIASGGYLIVKKLLFHSILPGYTSLMVVILFFGGIQLISLGILGEYIARLFVESKQRPLYLVESIIQTADKL